LTIAGPPGRGYSPERRPVARSQSSWNHQPDYHHKVNDMSALGWVATGHRLLSASLRRRRNPRKSAARGSTPRLETLESISLLSHSSLTSAALRKLSAAVSSVTSTPAESIPFTTKSLAVATKADSTPAETTQTQTATVSTTLTNFLQPFAPPIALFNPTLGTLVSVQITATANVTSQIQAQNTSTSSSTTVHGNLTGNFQILGLNTPLAGSYDTNTPDVTLSPYTGGQFFQPPSGVTFDPLTSSNTQNVTLTDPASLAFFTSTAAQQAITPVLSEVATASVPPAPGNVFSTSSTSGSGSISVTYNYIPQSPTITQLVRFGLHHQPTQLLLTFSGPLNAIDAATPANYYIVAGNSHGGFNTGTRTIQVVKATYFPNTFQVVLQPAQRLNVHYQYQLHINLPGYNGQSVIQFGGKQSLAGFLNPHTGQFVPVIDGNIPPQFLK
jgi:hypothetical protein